MAISKKAASSKAAPKASVDKCAECCDKIASLEKQVAELESQLGGLGDALASLTSNYNAGKEKLVSEVNELRENAKSWVTKQKEAMDSNNDGKIDFEEIYSYVFKRFGSRHNQPRK